MLTSQNLAFTIRKCIVVVSFFTILLCSVESAPWKLEAEIVSPEGGTVTPVGQYANGEKVSVTIAAKPGWFIYSLDVTHAVYDALDRAAAEVFRSLVFHDGFFTNRVAVTTMTSDTKIKAEFSPMVPTLVGNGGYLGNGSSYNIESFDHVTMASRFNLYAQFKGLWPLTFEWTKDGVTIPGQSGETKYSDSYLDFPEVDTSMSGIYTFTLKNKLGSASGSTKVTVAPILCYDSLGYFSLPNQVFFTNQITIEFETPYKNAHIFYTLDGTEPTLASREYVLFTSLQLFKTTTLRAVVFTSDFATHAFLDPIRFEKPTTVALSYATYGIGKIVGQIAEVPKGSTVTLRAIPNPGSFFVSWETPELSDDPVLNIRADADMRVAANFATPIAVKTDGQGTVELEPNSPAYTDGTAVLLFPKPTPGSYFVRWPEVERTSNPLAVITGFETVPTALFAPLPPGKVSLTVIRSGHGFVTGPLTNLFPSGSSVALQATPIDGRKFLRWSGDVTGTNTSITLDLPTSKIVYAEFENTPSLRIDMEAKKLFVQNDPYGIGTILDLFSSADLKNWHQEFSKTNFSGFVFKDWAPTNSATFFRAVQRGR